MRYESGKQNFDSVKLPLAEVSQSSNVQYEDNNIHLTLNAWKIFLKTTVVMRIKHI